MDSLSTAEELKRLTKEEHQALEGRIIRMIKRTTSLEDYQSLLRFFYGYYQPVETLILKYLTAADLPDVKNRRKSDLLSKDLKATGETVHGNDLAQQLPRIHNLTTAFAAFYVLEGSTIGGQYILDMLRQRIDLPGPQAISFFIGYGDSTMNYWSTFKSTLNHRFNNDQDITPLAATANETFQRFSYWAELNNKYARKENL